MLAEAAQLPPAQQQGAIDHAYDRYDRCLDNIENGPAGPTSGPGDGYDPKVNGPGIPEMIAREVCSLHPVGRGGLAVIDGVSTTIVATADGDLSAGDCIQIGIDAGSNLGGGSKKPPKKPRGGGPRAGLTPDGPTPGPNGTYEPNPKHGDPTRGIPPHRGASPAPVDGQGALDGSVPVPGKRQRVGVDPGSGSPTLLRPHRPDIYHGYCPGWDGLRSEQRRALIAAGLCDGKGRAL